MSGHDRDRAEAKRWSKKQKADCRADTRGGPWAGIPKCLIDSAAYRDLSLHARAVLVELVARMNGYNNDAIAVSQRELVEALRCTPRYVGPAIAELMDHGILDVTVEGQWKTRQARQYRLTFISTKSAPATNEYLRWTPTPKQSRGSHGEAETAKSASHGETERLHPASYGEAARGVRLREAPVLSASHGEPLISKPYPPAPEGERKGDDGLSSNTPKPAGHYFAHVTDEPRCCEQCGGAFMLERTDRAYPRRFCSETCRKRAERARAYERRKHESEPTPIGSILNGTVARLVAGARA